MTPGQRPGVPRTASPPPAFNFFFAAQLTVLACFIYSLVVSLAVVSGGLAFGLAHALGVAVGFACALGLATLRVSAPLGEALALRPPHPSAWLVPFLLLPGLLLISELDNLLAPLLPPLPPPPVLPPGVQPVTPVPLGLIVIAASVLLQPLAHEVFFRGLVYGRLQRIFSGAQTVIATSLLSWAFATLSMALLRGGTVHGIARLSVHALGIALLLGTLRLSSGSLYPSLLLAALFGGIDVLGSERALGIPGFDDNSAAHTPAHWLLPAALLSAAGLRLCQRLARLTLPGPQQPGGREQGT
jgi:membrane protease YdiL (CAAX protease family)